MQITRNSLETNLGPIDWFTGAVYIVTVATPSRRSRLTLEVGNDGNPATWGDHVTEEEYAAAPAIEL